MIGKDYQELLNTFNERWPIEAVRSMSIEQYTGLNDKETFCQWVETKAGRLGSIKGVNSGKFGLYRTRNQTEPKTAFIKDSKYCWSKKLGKTRNKAFEELKENICKIIIAAQITDLEAIDKINLHSYFKWKLAVLYSNGIIPPIFNHQVLGSLAKAYEVKFDGKKAEPVLRQIMASIPVEQCRLKYSFKLFKDFYLPSNLTSKAKKKNEEVQLRKFKKAGYTAEQKHSEMQNKLVDYLRNKYRSARIEMEENNIDVVMETGKEFTLFEVKSSQSPVYCIREALGQVLSYAYKCNTRKTKRIVVVGVSKPTEQERNFISYLCDHISIPFSYMTLPKK
ncbi:MAG: hypothetical protein MK214_13330 [Thalassotalea sp.]|nr:hypothetical protein [Thalassotalea sp.]